MKSKIATIGFPFVSLLKTHFPILAMMSFLVIVGVVMTSSSVLDLPASDNIEWNKRIQVASGDAHQGPWRMNDSEFYYVDDPAIAIHNDGRIGIVWADQREQDLFFRFYSAEGEPFSSNAVNVSQSPGIFSWLPRILIDPDDSELVYILWQDIEFTGGSHGGEIIFSRSVDGGKTFAEPINLSNTTAGAGKGRLNQMRWDNGSLDLAIDPDGTLYAAWTEYEGALRISRSTDGGQSFSEPSHIAGDNELPARGPALDVDNEGNVHLAWTVGEDNHADIHYAVSQDRGDTFTDPQILHESESHSDAPRIAVDGNGTIHVVYAASNDDLFSQYEVVYTRKTRGEDNFEEPRVVSSGHSGQVRSAAFPDLALSNNDNLYLLWEIYPDRSRHSRGLGFTYSSDGGLNFTDPGIIPGSADPEYGVNGSRQGSLMSKLAVNDQGSIAVANSTFMENEASYVWIFIGVKGQ